MPPLSSLFVLPEDLARARYRVEHDPGFAKLARDLRSEANRVDIDELPELHSTWWADTGRDLPWSDTYPEINRFTGQLPRAWATPARTCARAHTLFPDAGFDTRTRRLLSVLAQYSFEYEHYDVGLNYATWGILVLEAWELVRDRMPADEVQALDAFAHRWVEAIIANDEYWIREEPGGDLNNHYAWHKLARLTYGLLYDQPGFVEDALRGPKGVVESLERGFTDDGLWLEASLNYQFAQTTPMLIMARLLENAGHPFSLWHWETADGRSLRQSYDALIRILFPDGSLPNVGDCYGSRVRLGAREGYDLLYVQFREPVYAWILNRNPDRTLHSLFVGLSEPPATAQAPEVRTGLWPEHGYAMLRETEGRSYWDGLGWTAFGTYSNCSVHENRDKLSLMLFRHNHHWLVDCEARAGVYHAFSASVQRELNRSTICHNTVLVDGRDQHHPRSRLDLVEYSALPNAKRITFADLDGQLYDGVRQMRTLLVRPDYVLDLFQVQATDGEHDYEWLCHVDGDPVTDLDWRDDSLPDTPPWTWLRSPQALPEPVTAVSEEFAHGPERLHIDLAAARPVEVRACGFPRHDGEDAPVWPMRRLCVRGTDVWFLAVYRYGQARDEFSPATLAVETRDAGYCRVIVKLGMDEAHVHICPSLNHCR